MDKCYEKRRDNDLWMLARSPDDELTLEREEKPHRGPKHMKNRYKGWVKGCTRNREIDLEIFVTYQVIDIGPVQLVPILIDLPNHPPMKL